MKQIYPKLETETISVNKRNKLKLILNDLIGSDNQMKTINAENNYDNKSLKYNRTTIATSCSKNKVKKLYKDKFLNTIQDYAVYSQVEPLDDYNQNNEDLILKYNYSNPTGRKKFSYKPYMTRTKAEFFNKTKENIQTMLNKSRFHFRNLEKNEKLKPYESYIKINSKDFKGPVDSLGLILANKTIHDQILDNYKDREISHFGQSINKICHIKEMINLSKYVKVTSIMPRTFEKEFLQQENKNQDINNNNNDQNNENEQNTKNNKTLKTTIINHPTLLSIDFIKGWVYFPTGFYQNFKTCPESREQFTFNYDPVTNNIFLFSGNSCYIGSQQLWKYSLTNLQWIPIKPTTFSMDARSGHTAIIYKTKLIIFGGRYLHNTMFCDLDYYNIDNNTWTMGQVNTNYFLKLRRNHISCLIGNQMFIHGGIDDQGEYLDDSYLLSLNGNFRWTKATIMAYGPPPKLGYHSCCLVAPKEILKNPKFSVYKFPDISLTDDLNTQIKEKGLYVFGGKKSELKDPSNKLWLLKIGRKPLEWIDIRTRGKPPCPRYLCSMNYYEEGNFIIIHGGKTKTLRNENILKDTYLFELYRWEWIRVNYGFFEPKIKPRFSHSGIIYQGKLIIFGGVNEQGFSGSNFFLIKLTPEDFNGHTSPKKRASILKNPVTLVSENKFKTIEHEVNIQKKLENIKQEENNNNNVKRKSISKTINRSKPLLPNISKKITKDKNKVDSK